MGMLYKTQCMLDESLTAMERLSLTEQAIEFLEQALAVRIAELGNEHPHSVASQSALGSTIASQLTCCSIATNQARTRVQTIENDGNEMARGRTTLTTSTRNCDSKSTRHSTRRRPCQEYAYKNITTTSAAAAAQNLAVILKTRATLATPMDEDLLQEAKLLYEQALL